MTRFQDRKSKGNDELNGQEVRKGKKGSQLGPREYIGKGLGERREEERKARDKGKCGLW
jgi:hypothetical protein